MLTSVNEPSQSTCETEESIDPRILRSRRMLMDALFRLLSKKEFDDISIQEIANEATLNRATFYLHYPDKNALVQAMTAARFKELAARRGLRFNNCDSALRAIALGVCDYLASSAACPTHVAQLPIERSVIPVVRDMFLRGISMHPLAPGADPDLIATTAAWAIFGAARQWYETPGRIPAEEMAAKIEAMVGPIFLTATAAPAPR